ncbi:TetR-like C-terminal domain-containing protein [Paenibacillus sp. LHD-38]|uniref:TetR-like C-terminal domain-containing protein n=1 Tax=Paenibacillus sp. LHD-38 TaxID=3072143 RepID=UPI00280E7247|nr:TetR-like C-terminal domain-containing protein [Paenibacillus sp. LHD-38]MDQ8737012.1 TetR-like C-terminal domain-containing protein [Paenibacillus sp. LHD-38]
MIFNHIAQHATIYTTLATSDVLHILKEKMFVSLKQTIMEELLHEAHDLDQELLVVYTLHELLGLIFHWIESDFAHSAAYMQEQLVKILLHRPSNMTMTIKTTY